MTQLNQSIKERKEKKTGSNSTSSWETIFRFLHLINIMFESDSKKSPYSHVNQKNIYVDEMNYIHWYAGAYSYVWFEKKNF